MAAAARFTDRPHKYTWLYLYMHVHILIPIYMLNDMYLCCSLAVVPERQYTLNDKVLLPLAAVP